jgi:formiminotetrahydrofolate cyclodeaminase
MLKDMNLEDFLKKLASNDPVPGGGSVAALSAAVSAALSEMVANLTAGKKNYEAVSDQMSKMAVEMNAHREAFVHLIDKDASSFDGVMKAFKLPKNTDDEKAERTRQIQLETKYAASVPLEVAQKAALLFNDIECLVESGNKNALSDALVAAMMARTAILGALYNVKINLGAIKDEDFVQETTREVYRLEKIATAHEAKILAKAML